MADDTTHVDKQDGQKTLVSFIVGLLIGGMLVWAFSGPTVDAPQDDERDDTTAGEVDGRDTEDDMDVDADTEADVTIDEPAEQAQLQVGNGSIVVDDQPAGNSVALTSATYPVSEGWIGVRTYTNDQLGRFINGVVRFSESQGLIPTDIILQSPTIPGQKYAIVIFTEDGDFDFSTAGDVQIDQVFDTFTAQ